MPPTLQGGVGVLFVLTDCIFVFLQDELPVLAKFIVACQTLVT